MNYPNTLIVECNGCESPQQPVIGQRALQLAFTFTLKSLGPHPIQIFLTGLPKQNPIKVCKNTRTPSDNHISALYLHVHQLYFPASPSNPADSHSLRIHRQAHTNEEDQDG